MSDSSHERDDQQEKRIIEFDMILRDLEPGDCEDLQGDSGKDSDVTCPDEDPAAA
jgi:hypothetical protein